MLADIQVLHQKTMFSCFHHVVLVVYSLQEYRSFIFVKSLRNSKLKLKQLQQNVTNILKMLFSRCKGKFWLFTMLSLILLYATCHWCSNKCLILQEAHLTIGKIFWHLVYCCKKNPFKTLQKKTYSRNHYMKCKI